MTTNRPVVSAGPPEPRRDRSWQRLQFEREGGTGSARQTQAVIMKFVATLCKGSIVERFRRRPCGDERRRIGSRGYRSVRFLAFDERPGSVLLGSFPTMRTAFIQRTPVHPT